MIKVLLSILLTLLPILTSADPVEINGIWYNLVPQTKEAEVTNNPNKYNGYIEIPASVTFSDIDYSVTSIGEFAFVHCSSLTSITIGNCLNSIGAQAFYGCTGLLSVNIPNSVISIGHEAFYGCSSLISIDIPNSVTSIGHDAFFGTAWYNNQPNGLVYAGKVAYDFKGEMSDNTNISIKEGTLGIADYAFSRCNGLTSVTIPNSVTSIAPYAFEGCSGLTSIDMPNSLTSIGKFAFYGCFSLTSVTIPYNVTCIDISAFCNCHSLTSVSIPNSVTTIDEFAFSSCTSLTSVTISSSVTSIGYYAFSECPSLTSIMVEKDNPKYDSRNDCNAIIETSSNTLLFGCNSTFIPNSVTSIESDAFRGSALTSVTIPNSVTSIGRGAFYGCSALISVIIGSGVGNLYSNSFSICTNLTDVYCLAENVPYTLNDAFDYTPCASATLHVPAVSLDAYKQTSPWSQFGRIVVLTDDDPSPTGINSLKADDILSPEATYSLDGRHLFNPQRGMNIIRMSDGTAKKVIMR